MKDFLTVLKSNDRDLVTWSVLADWCEEHNEPYIGSIAKNIANKCQFVCVIGTFKWGKWTFNQPSYRYHKIMSGIQKIEHCILDIFSYNCYNCYTKSNYPSGKKVVQYLENICTLANNGKIQEAKIKLNRHKLHEISRRRIHEIHQWFDQVGKPALTRSR